MSRYDDTILAEHWIVRPLGDATPPTKRGKKFAMDDHAGARACYLAALADGHAPTIVRYQKTLSPCSRTPKRHETRVHPDRLGTDLSGLRACLIGRPLDWPTYRSVRVGISGRRLRMAGVHDASAIVASIRGSTGYAQPWADVEVTIVNGADATTYEVVREDGSIGTQDDADVRAVIGPGVDGGLRQVEDRIDSNARRVEVGLVWRDTDDDVCLAVERAVSDRIEAAYPWACPYVYRSRRTCGDFVEAQDPDVRAAVRGDRAAGVARTRARAALTLARGHGAGPLPRRRVRA